MKILFVCNIVDEKKHSITPGFQAAAIKFQRNLARGFEQNGVKVDYLSEPLIPSFSLSNKCLFSKGYRWSHNEGSDDYCVPFLNIFPIKNLVVKFHFKRYIKKWIKLNGPNCFIVSYSPRMPYSFSCKYATKKKIKNTLVVPDLPEYAGLSKMGNFFYRLLKKFDVKYFYKSCKKIDSFVFFADNMKEKFDNDIRFITVECMVNPDMYTNQNEHESAIKHIVYTGGLEEEYGIKLLLDAFILINRDDYCLDICGSGNAANLVNDYANRYKGINFYGLVSSTEAFNLQMNAAVLVNPRPNNGIFTRFSFPSKNAEYLMTGIPTICFKLAGIPDEYDSLLYYFRSSDPKEMSEDIVKVCNISDVCRKEIFRKNREYMINYKNIKYQTKRIIDQLVGIDAR